MKEGKKTSVSYFNYNPFPLGWIPKELQRPELEQVRELGYDYRDPRNLVTMFEDKVAEFAGAPYAVAVDCCTHGLFLAMRYLWEKIPDIRDTAVFIPQHTYTSVPMAVRQAGFNPHFRFVEWSGMYRLEPLGIWDAAVRWKRDMYKECGGGVMVLSFQIKKRIPIGRGGMILLDCKKQAEWLRLASYDGRDLTCSYHLPWHVRMEGWHYYMTPEDAARGLILMDKITDEGDSGDWQSYPNLLDYDFFKHPDKETPK